LFLLIRKCKPAIETLRQLRLRFEAQAGRHVAEPVLFEEVLFKFHAAKGRKKILHKKIFCIKSFLYLCPSLIVKQNTNGTFQ
jgi:hypothetical protein